VHNDNASGRKRVQAISTFNNTTGEYEEFSFRQWICTVRQRGTNNLRNYRIIYGTTAIEVFLDLQIKLILDGGSVGEWTDCVGGLRSQNPSRN